MANKTLTAKVKLDTSSAEASLKRLEKKINNVQSAINKTSRKGGLEQSVNKAALAQERLKQATLKTQLAEEKLTAQKAKTAQATKNCENATQKLNTALKSSNTHANSLLSTIKRLAATYLGVMGMKATINTSDTITSTQNKLNNLNGGDADLTQSQMDTMYSSANKVRMAYTDMLSNASKSMTLAGDAFQGNMDNAIRFQEIMAETYALGGASAPEMSTSMYQMIQALGAGTLAGDELRSVREGAPLAYKAIEEFAQGIYNTEESLKDLASQGKITSDMVVAAIMNAGDKIDEQFNKTAITFGQAWNRVKNAAVKAFEPVSNMLSEMLNRAAKNGAFEKIEAAFWNISKVIQIVFKLIENMVIWIIDNWDWIQQVIVAGLIIMASAWVYQAGVAVLSCIQTLMAMTSVKWVTMTIAAAVLALAYIFILWKTGAIDTCQAIVYAILIIGFAVTIVMSIITGGIVLIPVLIASAIALIITHLEYVVAALYGAASVIWNLLVTLVTVIIKNAIVPLTTAWDNFANFFGNLFNDPITAIICCFEKLADSVLSILQSIARGIDAVFGSNLESAVQGWRDGLSSKADNLVERYGNGTYEEKSNVTDQVLSLIDNVQADIMWNTSSAWNTGKEHGTIAKDWLSGLGSNLQTGFGGLSLDNLGSKLGLTFGEQPDYGALDTSGAYNQPENLLGDIANDVGDIKDSVALSEEDLDYLRKIAEMEWKKEYTSNTITIDMTNYNSVTGESDLDGIVTKLADKLHEELNVMANGVYA